MKKPSKSMFFIVAFSILVLIFGFWGNYKWLNDPEKIILQECQRIIAKNSYMIKHQINLTNTKDELPFEDNILSELYVTIQNYKKNNSYKSDFSINLVTSHEEVFRASILTTQEDGYYLILPDFNKSYHINDCSNREMVEANVLSLINDISKNVMHHSSPKKIKKKGTFYDKKNRPHKVTLQSYLFENITKNDIIKEIEINKMSFDLYHKHLNGFNLTGTMYSQQFIPSINFEITTVIKSLPSHELFLVPETAEEINTIDTLLEEHLESLIQTKLLSLGGGND